MSHDEDDEKSSKVPMPVNSTEAEGSEKKAYLFMKVGGVACRSRLCF